MLAAFVVADGGGRIGHVWRELSLDTHRPLVPGHELLDRFFELLLVAEQGGELAAASTGRRKERDAAGAGPRGRGRRRGLGDSRVRGGDGAFEPHPGLVVRGVRLLCVDGLHQGVKLLDRVQQRQVDLAAPRRGETLGELLEESADHELVFGVGTVLVLVRGNGDVGQTPAKKRKTGKRRVRGKAAAREKHREKGTEKLTGSAWRSTAEAAS